MVLLTLLGSAARRERFLRALRAQHGYCDPYEIGMVIGYVPAEIDTVLAGLDAADLLVWDSYGSGTLRLCDDAPNGDDRDAHYRRDERR